MNILKLVQRLLSWLCPPHLYEEIEGDLIQRFQRDVKLYGARKAKRKFIWNAIRFFRPGIVLRNKVSVELNQLDMLVSHLRFSVRIFLGDKFFSTLNVLGLALGIAMGIILLLTIQNDFTYDHYHTKYERIYRLGAHIRLARENEFNTAYSARELDTILIENFPEIQSIVRADKLSRTLVAYENKDTRKTFYEEGILLADTSYFQIFTAEFVEGSSHAWAMQPKSVIITESASRKYFGDVYPLDKMLVVEGVPMKVTGVIKNLPDNVHLKFDFLVSGIGERTLGHGDTDSETLWNTDVYTYLLLPHNYTTANFVEKFHRIYEKHFKLFGDQHSGSYAPVLERLVDGHFYSVFEDDEPHGKPESLYVFSTIAIFIILLASINYMNLSTSKAMKRATEIVIKRITGLRRRFLVLSFLAESILLSFFALALAIAFVLLVVNSGIFYQLAGKNLSLNFLENPVLLIGAPLITLLIGIISGLYPAFYLSNIPTLPALKGSFKNHTSGIVLRKILITAQFSISIFVVVCTMFMQNQIEYIQDRDLGFDKDNIVVLRVQDTVVRRNISSITRELLSNPNIISATTTSSWSMIGENVDGEFSMYLEGENGMIPQGVALIFVGESYLATMGMTLLSGRDFKAGNTLDINSFIANESAVKMMNWRENALGKRVDYFHEKGGEVIGVVKDFNFNSLHNPVKPLLIVKVNEEIEATFLHLRIKNENIPETIQYLRGKLEDYDPSHPFEYFFFDQHFNEQYQADITQNELLAVLSYVCIFISLLGLVGLSAFNAGQRTKEIGIRKVLGATVLKIVLLLSRSALWLVFLSSMLVIPLSYWAMMFWQRNFSYPMPFNYLLYPVVTLAAMGFVFLTILLQSFKTSRANPVDALKYE